MKMNKLALSVLASGMLFGMMGAGMTVSAHSVAKHVSATSIKYPTVIMTTVYTGKQDGKKGWPEFTPSNFSVPANTRVELIIHSYDDGPAAIMGDNYKVKGTVGGYELVDGKKFTGFNKNNVAHTITVPSLNLNIPIPPKTGKEAYVTVVAQFNTGKAGNYNWQCMGACGSGSSGWMGAMATNGWMKGAFSVYNQ